MTFKDNLEQDLSIFFNANEFAETIYYNGNSVLAIIDRLDEPKRYGANVSNVATIFAKGSDIGNASYNDTIIFDGQAWVIETIQKSDANVCMIQCRRKEGYSFK